MTTRYEVAESRMWLNADGRRASLFGAVPYATTAEAEGWAIVAVGFSVRDNRTGTVGTGRPPYADRADAEAHAARLNAL